MASTQAGSEHPNDGNAWPKTWPAGSNVNDQQGWLEPDGRQCSRLPSIQFPYSLH